MIGISAVLITKNEEKRVGDCLASLAFADEIVVVDSGSDDGTEGICRRDRRVRWYAEEWKGFGPQKNSALDKAKGPWIFSIDADERVSPALAAEIARLEPREDIPAGYRVSRRSYFGKTWVRHGGWYPDYTVRLWRKSAGRFNERSVHEAVHLAGPAETLEGDLVHYTYRDTEDFLERMNRYSTLGARELHREGRGSSLADLLVRPPFTFFKMYVLKAGFLDGVLGFRLAALYAMSTFIKYAKLGEPDGE